LVRKLSGQSDARRPPRQLLRLLLCCRRSYMISALPQTALQSRSSGEDMPLISVDGISGLEGVPGAELKSEKIRRERFARVHHLRREGV
jgi:hypothetical protein